MIKLIRETNRKYPWFLIGVIGIIVVTFIVGMGWWEFDGGQRNQVATIGDMAVSVEEYERIYRNMEGFYRETLKQDIKPEELEQQAIQELISEKVWTLAGQEMGLTISPNELSTNIVQTKAFQQDGKFDAEYYSQKLARIGYTPALYETGQKNLLLAEKAKAVVLEAVALTPSEIAEADALLGGQSPDPSHPTGLNRDMIVNSFLYQKQHRALQAYTVSLKAHFAVEIHEENL